MSFNELTGDYPWLTKRMATALAFRNGREASHPKRHGFAWFLSIFIPHLGSGGIVSLMIAVMIIGILAAIAIPAYQDYVVRASVYAGYNTANEVKVKVTDYYIQRNRWPVTMMDIEYPYETLSDPMGKYEIDIYENGLIGVSVGTDAAGETKYLVLEPAVENQQITWSCYGSNLPEQHLPTDCR